jgi:predicted nuclease with TOPRIM domain
MVLLHLLVAQDDDLQDKLMKRGRVKLSQGIICLFTRLCAYGEMNVELKNSSLPCKYYDALCAENEKLQHETSCRNKHVEALKRACNNLDFENDELRSSLANLQSEIDLLKSNASMPCNSCVALNINLDVARSKIALLEKSASLPCVSCESLLAKINELKLTHTTCVDELERARAEICELKSMPCSKCSLLPVEGACHTSCDDDNALRDVNDVACSCDFVCTSCIDLESEVLALKKMREDMSAKLVEHDEMSANLEKENELLRTTYAKCIEEEINNLRNMTCGTCERRKSQNEVLRTRCKSLCVKSLDSRFSCHSDVDASKFASSKPESTSSLEPESLDGGKCSSALDSSPIATPKLVASSGVAQGDSNGKGASHFFGTHTSKPNFHCTFCKKDGHTVEFCFRRVKHERRVRAKAVKKPRSLSHGTCDSNVGTKSSIEVDASCSKSQGISHLQENGNSSTQTVPPDRPLYHCSLCGKDEHQESFCYHRARKMRRACASRPLVVRSPSHGMDTCEPKKAQFMDEFYDTHSSE